MILLLRSLLRSALADGAADDATIRAVADAGANEWRRVEEDLDHHRIGPLIGATVARGPLAAALPGDVRARLLGTCRRTDLTNRVLMLATARALAALRERGVEPVAWKGIVLADSCYPEPAARWMGDVDFSIEPGDIAAARAAFASIGMRAPEALQTADALYFENKMGVMFDVHHRVRLFEGRDPEGLYRDIAPRHVPSESLRILAPDAMLVHLIVHMEGHRDEMGYLLSWIVDVALFARRWGGELDVQRLADLMPAEAHWASLLRIVKFLETEFGVTPPPCLARLAGDVDTFELDALLRDRRRAPWGLPRPRGFARVVKHRLFGTTGHELPMPSMGDLLRWPGDALRARRLRRAPVPSVR